MTRVLLLCLALTGLTACGGAGAVVAPLTTSPPATTPNPDDPASAGQLVLQLHGSVGMRVEEPAEAGGPPRVSLDFGTDPRGEWLPGKIVRWLDPLRGEYRFTVYRDYGPAGMPDPVPYALEMWWGGDLLTVYRDILGPVDPLPLSGGTEQIVYYLTLE